MIGTSCLARYLSVLSQVLPQRPIFDFTQMLVQQKTKYGPNCTTEKWTITKKHNLFSTTSIFVLHIASLYEVQSESIIVNCPCHSIYFDDTSLIDDPIIYLYHVKLVHYSVFPLVFFYFPFIFKLFSWPPTRNQN